MEPALICGSVGPNVLRVVDLHRLSAFAIIARSETRILVQMVRVVMYYMLAQQWNRDINWRTSAVGGFCQYGVSDCDSTNVMSEAPSRKYLNCSSINQVSWRERTVFLIMH